MNPGAQESYSRYKKYATDLRRYYRMPTVQVSLSLVLSLFITAFFVLLAIRPTLVTIAKLNKTIEESEKTLKQMETKAAALEKIAVTWEEIKPVTKFIDNSIPVSGPGYQSLTKAMEILAIESGVTISSETVGEALTYSKIVDPYSGNKRTVVKMPFTIKVAGDYPSTSKFLAAITSMDRMISIDSIGFAKDAKLGKDSPGVTFTLTGNVSYLADEKQVAKIISKEKGKK